MASYTPPLLRKASYSLSNSDPRDFPSSLSIHTSSNQSFPFPSPNGSSSLSLASASSSSTYHPTPSQSTTPLIDNSSSDRGRTPSSLQISLPPGQVNNLSLKTAQLGNGSSKPGGNQSIFQTSTIIRSRLLSIPNFPPYLSYSPSTHLTVDGETTLSVVQHLWACIRLGSSLAFLVNRVGETGVWDRFLGGKPWETIDGEEMRWEEGEGAINWGQELHNAKACKRPLAKCLGFLSTLKQAGGWENDDLWNLADAFKDDTNALVKILHTLTLLLDLLPSATPAVSPSQLMSPGPSSFLPGSQSPFGYAASQRANFMTGVHAIPGAVTPGGEALMAGGAFGAAVAAGSGAMGEAGNLVRELMETERKYVQELEVLQSYSRSLVQNGLISQDTAHLIFSNLDKLLDFQRRFQISLETEAEKGSGVNWRLGDWGRAFVKHEKEFEVYEPFCANYLQALDLATAETANLQGRSDLILEPTRELPAFLIKPIQRITKYPLLLSSLVKATTPNDYEHHFSVVSGLACVKRITDKVNETSREKENAATAKELIARVEDWKGHDPKSFGKLIIDDQLVATKGNTDREYHVFLFEQMLLCCKDASEKQTKKNKSNSLKPRPIGGGGSGFGKSTRTMLSVKGRIYVNNLTHTEVMKRRDGGSGLQLFWRCQDAPDTTESLVLHMRTDELLLKWETSVRRLIADYRRSVQQRRSGPSSGSISQHHHTLSTGSSNGGSRRYYQTSVDATSPRSTYGNGQMDSNNLSALSYPDEFDDDDGSQADGAWETDERGLPRPRRDSEAANWNPSAVGRRSAPPARDGSSADPATRARARTEEQNGVVMNDWRSQQQASSIPAMPGFSRNMSVSSASGQSEVSFGNSPPAANGLPRGARHQLSTSNLRRGQMTPEDAPSTFPVPYSSGNPIPARYANSSVPHRNNSQSMAPPPVLPIPPQYRSRSASSPNAYQPQLKEARPPLPITTEGFPVSANGSNQTGGTGSANSSTEGIPNQLAMYNSSKSSLTTTSRVDDKRGSSESNSTSISEESQPYPTTPFGSGGVGRNGSGSLPISRQGSGDSTVVSSPNPPAKSSLGAQGSSIIRIHFEQELLKISIPGGSRIEDVAEKVLKKISRGRVELADKAIQMKYTDPDGDMIQLKTQDDWLVCIEDHESDQIELHATILEPHRHR